jgi:hypothetical protein
MAEHKTQVDYVEVKAEDIIGERKALYEAFMTASKVGIALTAVLLVAIYLFWG